MNAELITQIKLEKMRPQIRQYLLDKGFTPAAADIAIRAYIDTKLFLARETGEEQ